MNSSVSGAKAQPELYELRTCCVGMRVSVGVGVRVCVGVYLRAMVIWDRNWKGAAGGGTERD